MVENFWIVVEAIIQHIYETRYYCEKNRGFHEKYTFSLSSRTLYV